MSDFLDARYEKDPSVVYREIAGEAILVPIKRRTADMESIYTLNQTGAQIWDLLDGQHTLGEIKAELVQEYGDIPPDEVEADLCEFIDYLLEFDGVKKVN